MKQGELVKQLLEARAKIDEKLVALGSPPIEQQLVSARQRIDGKLAKLGHPATDEGIAESLMRQLAALQTSVNALANRPINITVPERQVTINNQQADPGDLEVQGPGGKMSVRRIRRVV